MFDPYAFNGEPLGNYEVKSIYAITSCQIWGTRNCWSLSAQAGLSEPARTCEVKLEIQGDRKSGYHLVMSPEGFFTADSWHETRQAALETAHELFGVDVKDWTE